MLVHASWNHQLLQVRTTPAAAITSTPVPACGSQESEPDCTLLGTIYSPLAVNPASKPPGPKHSVPTLSGVLPAMTSLICCQQKKLLSNQSHVYLKVRDN